MTTKITIDKAKESARISTLKVSQIKDWRLRTKRSRELKQLAKHLLESNECYIVATDTELAAKYPEFHSTGNDTGEKFVWEIVPRRYGESSKYVKLSFAPIYNVNDLV